MTDHLKWNSSSLLLPRFKKICICKTSSDIQGSINIIIKETNQVRKTNQIVNSTSTFKKFGLQC